MRKVYKFTFQDGSESLMHYGVKGMKWGVWNAETAARYGRTTKGLRFKADESHPFKEAYLRSRPWDDSANSPMEDMVKDAESIPKYWETHEDYGKAIKDDLDALRMEPEQIDQAFQKVNNLYGAPGYQDNCMGCAIATILRTKGFDVEADSTLADYTDDQGGAIESLNMSKTPFVSSIFGRDLAHLNGSKDRNGEYLYDVNGSLTETGRKFRQSAWESEPVDSSTGKFVDQNHADRAFYAAVMGESQPEGSYGVVRGSYNGGSGHILTYRIENGRPMCYDGQDSKPYTFEEATRDFNWTSIKTARLDDVDPSDINYEELGKWGGVRPHESHWDD